jgi:hypothetical protein
MDEELRIRLKDKLGMFYNHIKQKEELKKKYQQMRDEELLKKQIQESRWSVKKVESDYIPTIEEFDKLFGK